MNIVLTEAFAGWSVVTGEPAPPTTTPPGTIGIPVADFNPYAYCRDGIASGIPKVEGLGSTMKYQLYAIRVLLGLTAFLALLTLLWRWWREGAAGVWLLRRMSGAKGTYIVPNPSTLFLLPLVAFTAACQVIVYKSLLVIHTHSISSLDWMLLLFILCMVPLWLAGFIQGAALLFSVDRFLLPGGNRSIWVSSTSSNPLSIQNVAPWLLNVVLVALPAIMVVGAVTAGVLASLWQNLATSTVQDAIVDMDALVTKYATANGMVLFPNETTDLDDQFWNNQLIFVRSKNASMAAFIIVVAFDVVFIVLYYRFAFAVISMIRRQLALLKQTSEHFDSVANSSRRPSRVFERPPPHRMSSDFPPPGEGGPRRSNTFGRDEGTGEEERVAKRRRLLMAYYSIAGLAGTMLVIAAIDIAFCIWGVTNENFRLFVHLLPAALWVWTIASLFAVVIMAWQAFTAYTPAAPARSLVALRAPPDPNRSYYYGRDDEDGAADESDSAYRSAVLAKAQAEARQRSSFSAPATSPFETPQLTSDPFIGSHRPFDAVQMERHPYAAYGARVARQGEPSETVGSSQQSSDPSSKPSEPSSKPSSEEARTGWIGPPVSPPFHPSHHFRSAFEPQRRDDDDESIR